MKLSLFDFKRKHGLSHSDIQSITGCSLTISREWAKGATVPEYIAQMLHGIDIVIDRIKTDNGIFTDVDAQHAAHIIEKQNKEIAKLEEMVKNLNPNSAQMRPVYNADGAVVAHAMPTMADIGVKIISFTAELKG